MRRHVFKNRSCASWLVVRVATTVVGSIAVTLLAWSTEAAQATDTTSPVPTSVTSPAGTSLPVLAVVPLLDTGGQAPVTIGRCRVSVSYPSGSFSSDEVAVFARTKGTPIQANGANRTTFFFTVFQGSSQLATFPHSLRVVVAGCPIKRGDVVYSWRSGLWHQVRGAHAATGRADFPLSAPSIVELIHPSEPNLHIGSSGLMVVYLQLLLGRNGHTVPVSGVFDQATQVALNGYQSTHGLPSTSAVGPATWRSLGN